MKKIKNSSEWQKIAGEWRENAIGLIKKNTQLKQPDVFQYPEGDLNPHSRYGHWILSPTCLPFHHPGILLSFVKKGKRKTGILRFQKGAGNETRTRDPDLGKVVLYQLSYSRRY